MLNERLFIFRLNIYNVGKRPRSVVQAKLEALLLKLSSEKRVQIWRCHFSICELSQVLKSGLAYMRHISLLYARIGAIIVSNILQARDVFSLLRFVCRLELNEAWRAFSLIFSCARWHGNFLKRRFEFLNKCILVQYQ